MEIKEEEIRSLPLLGEEKVKKLHRAKVAVFGIGGVGGYVCEALARSGIGDLTLIDRDTVSLSNINRQIIALHSTVGRPKAEVMKERIRDINPDCNVTALELFYLPENADSIDLSHFDCVVDAIDNVTAKLELITRCKKNGVPILSAMGAGNKRDPSLFRVADISKTSGCPLARVMRRELRARGIEHLTVVYSPENPQKSDASPASLPFVPPVMGLLLAGEAVEILAQTKNQ